MTGEETAREHINNALAMVVALRTFVEQPERGALYVEARDLRAIESRLQRANEQIGKGNY